MNSLKQYIITEGLLDALSGKKDAKSICNEFENQINGKIDRAKDGWVSLSLSTSDGKKFTNKGIMSIKDYYNQTRKTDDGEKPVFDNPNEMIKWHNQEVENIRKEYGWSKDREFVMADYTIYYPNPDYDETKTLSLKFESIHYTKAMMQSDDLQKQIQDGKIDKNTFKSLYWNLFVMLFNPDKTFFYPNQGIDKKLHLVSDKLKARVKEICGKGADRKMKEWEEKLKKESK